jgi:hypothetical protein
MFSKDIEENCDTLRELLRALPPSQRSKAARAAAKIEKAFMALQKDHPKDGAVALGAAFAVFMIGARITERAKEGAHDGLIKLVS